MACHDASEVLARFTRPQSPMKAIGYLGSHSHFSFVPTLPASVRLMIAMDEVKSPLATDNVRKRPAPDTDSPTEKPLNLKGSQFMPTPPDTDQSSTTSSSLHFERHSRQTSPAPRNSAMSNPEDVIVLAGPEPKTSAGPTHSASVVTTLDVAPPAKKQKLTADEKERKKKEQEAQEAERARKRAQKDEEKRIKEEEKAKKAEEREMKKREKEEEADRKAQEKLKKESRQLRLGSFFRNPPTLMNPDSPGATSSIDPRRSKSVSREPFDSARKGHARPSNSPVKCISGAKSGYEAKAQPELSDYKRHFLPFSLTQKDNVIYAPTGVSQVTADKQQAFDDELHDPSLQEKYDLGLVESYASLGNQFRKMGASERGLPLLPTKDLVKQYREVLLQPQDPMKDSKFKEATRIMKRATQRHIEFHEDVRPPYIGTYSKVASPRTIRKAGRNPFIRARPDTDYDYDSEAEWVEPEEGEDLLTDEEDEAESQAADDEDIEFLDDAEDALKGKRKIITNDLDPRSTGICWQDSSGKFVSSVALESPSKSMAGMSVGFIIPGFKGRTIDPFSTAYWESDSKSGSTPVDAVNQGVNSGPSLDWGIPGRPPLHPRRSHNGTLDRQLVGASAGEKGPITSVAAQGGAKPARKPGPKPLCAEDMAEFKEAVVNSPLSKVDLLKGLKARYVPCRSWKSTVLLLTPPRFPKLTHDTIKATLGDHFARIGSTKAEKKWIFVPGS